MDRRPVSHACSRRASRRIVAAALPAFADALPACPCAIPAVVPTLLAFSLALLAALSVGPATAADCIRYEDTNHPIGTIDLSDAAWAVGVIGTLALVESADYSVHVIDVSDPYQPVRRGRLEIPWTPFFGFAGRGSYAFATCPDGLKAIDLSDPDLPRIVGELATDGGGAIAISGSFAYVAGHGLDVIDIGDPLNPHLAGSLRIPGNTSGLVLSGHYAFLSTYDAGLAVVDVADPANPLQVASLDMGTDIGWAVTMSGRTVYLGDQDHMGHNYLRLIDVADPLHPALVTTMALPIYITIPYSIAAAGDEVYIPGGDDGLLVIDAGDPARPFLQETFLDDPRSGAVWYEAAMVTVAPGPAGPRLFLTGNVSYDWMAFIGWLHVFDLTGRPQPSAQGSVPLPCCPNDVAAAGPFAYVANGSLGLHVIDASDPARPSIAATLDTPDRASSVAARGKHAYVADDHDGLLVIDVAAPRAPRLCGSVDTPGRAFDVAVSGERAYVADGSAGLQVIDVSDPESPWIVGSCDTPATAGDVAVDGGYAYVTDGGHPGLQIIDIADPAHPHIVGSVDVHPEAYSGAVAVWRDRAYVLTSWAGLYVVDVHDPARPSVVDWMSVFEEGWGLSASAGTLYLADALGGLQVVDVTRPGGPRNIGVMDTEGYTVAAAPSGPLVFVIDEDACGHEAAIYVYPRQCAPSITTHGRGVSPSRDSLAWSVEPRVRAVPNPARRGTTIRVNVPDAGVARVSIWDVAGRLVRELCEETLPQGVQSLWWDGTDRGGHRVPAGVYWVRLTTESQGWTEPEDQARVLVLLDSR